MVCYRHFSLVKIACGWCILNSVSNSFDYIYIWSAFKAMQTYHVSCYRCQEMFSWFCLYTCTLGFLLRGDDYAKNDLLLQIDNSGLCRYNGDGRRSPSSCWVCVLICSRDECNDLVMEHEVQNLETHMCIFVIMITSFWSNDREKWDKEF